MFSRGFVLTLALLMGVTSSGWTMQSASDFTLMDTRGLTHTLSDYQGSYVVLEWHNSDCPFVKKHYDSGNMQSLQKELTSKGIVWLQVNSSAPGKQGHYSPQQYNEINEIKQAAPTATLLDSDGKVGKLYGAKTTPHMYIINPDGDLVYKGAIDSIASANPADIDNAENYVLSALNQSLSGQDVAKPSTKPYGCSVKY